MVGYVFLRLYHTLSCIICTSLRQAENDALLFRTFAYAFEM